MIRKSCPPGQANINGRCTPFRSLGTYFASIPTRSSVPSGGLFPFTNSVGQGGITPAPSPSPSPSPTPPFTFEFSGHIDSSISETIPLNLPFDKISLPLTLEIVYTFTPADYRTNDGGFGGFGFSLSVQDKNFGFEIQGSNPSNFFVLTYTNYRPDAPGFVLVDRRDYQIAVWPPGTPVVRVTLDADLVPRLYFDGVEAIISPPTPPFDASLQEGNNSTVYGYNGAPGRSVDVNPLKLVGALIPPPAPL